MLFIFLILFTGTDAILNENCDHLVLLHKDELKELPDYPFSVPEIECRWTVVAEPNRRILFSCVSNKIHESAKKDTSACYGEFTVDPEGETKSTHCHDKTFVRIGEINRMNITYSKTKDPSELDVSGFKCHLYAEISQESSDAGGTVTGNINAEECDYFIYLQKNDLIRLDNPIHVEEEPGWSSCRWDVISPLDTKVKLTCPFTDKPPDPVTMQVYPCSGVFSVKFDGEIQTHSCTEKAFSVNSTTNGMEIYYANPLSKRYEDYQCYVYFDSPLDETGANDSPYADCDEFIEVGFKEVKELNSPNFPEKSKPGSVCRWHVLSPVNSRLVLNCNFPNIPSEQKKTDPDQASYCPPGFTITYPGGKQITRCGNFGFYQFSPKNSMIITYKTPERQHVEVFQCHVHAEKKKLNCGNCTGVEAFDYDECHHNVRVYREGIIERLIPPEPWTPCLWNIEFPSEKNVYVSCSAPKNDQHVKDCKGFFTVYKSGKFEDGDMYCYDEVFWLEKDGDPEDRNKLLNIFITYSGQEHTEPFNCTVASFNKTCDIYMTLGHMSAQDYQEIKLPFWPTYHPPWKSCTWTIIAPSGPVSYQAVLKCYKDEPAEKFASPCHKPITVSLSGNLSGIGFEHCLDTPYTHTSHYNVLSVRLEDIPHDSKPYDLIGCRAHMSRKASEGEGELCECGWSNIHTKKNRRIANGKMVYENEFPMMAGLVDMKENNKTLFCGGTIISRQYILTAALCITEAQTSDYAVGVIVDAFDLTPEVNHQNALYAADQLIAHEKYSKSPHFNDIGLVHVKERIIFDERVGPVCLPFYEKNNNNDWKYFEARKVFAVGWGEPSDADSYYLKKLEGEVATDIDCEYTNPELNPKQHICFTHERNTVCKIDTGGPLLFVDHEVDRIKVIGILFTHKQCEGHYHTKATELLPLMDWVSQNTPGVFYCKSL